MRRARHVGRARRGDTPPPRTGGSEAEVLRGFLDYLRESVSVKVEGAPEPAVRTAAVPSGTHLLGLLGHLTSVERATFLGERVDDWSATFRAAPGDSVADVVARYRQAVAEANGVLDGCTDLSAPVPRPRSNGPAPSLRWALTHLIEETGRHAGHADILRELIDGATGR
ncbi:DinB family protein [Streptomyces sp. WAC 01529]|uniref:DinB family protein n=1 Tax=Streptomyces sp. WAC 01529 TaxID=2203205 RepID=UPI0019CFCE4B|nr:DinB family protein [Streptomyces sp. WAC 01529]